jgi:hypothetical protein
MKPCLQMAAASSICMGCLFTSGCSKEASTDPADNAGQTAASTATEATQRPAGDGQRQKPPAVGDFATRLPFYTVDRYDDQRDAAQDLARTIERAKAEHKHILVQVGGDWCGWCKRMSRFIETNEQVRAHVSRDYLLMKVTYDEKQPNTAFLSQYPKIKGYPHLFVLSSDGKLLHSQETADLEEGSAYNEQVYVSFLEKWKPGS